MRRKSKEFDGDLYQRLNVTVNLTLEEMIIFEQELLDFEKQHNIILTHSEFFVKILRDYVQRKYKHKRKSLPHFTLRNY